MILLRLWYFVSGYLVLRVEGGSLERLLNLLVAHRIYVWDVQQHDRVLHLKIGIAGFRRIRPLVRRTRCRARIELRQGAPFLLRDLRRRSVLAFGLFFFIVMLYMVTSVVWVVRVSGTENLDSRVVLDLVRESGLRPGVPKRTLDLKKIETDIVLELQQISWAKIRVQGTVYTVEVIEKTKEPETEEPLGPCDIVAKKSGTIRNMLVLMGRPLVREGQTVTEGQVLVSGALLGAPRPSQDLDHMPNVAKYLHARAIIKAETTYQAYREVSIDEVRLVETGRVTKKLMITIGRTSTVWGLPSTEYSHFIVRANPVLPWSGRNTSPLVEVHQLTYHEIVPSQVALDVEEAKHRAQAMAIDAINSLLPPEAEKLDVKSETFTHPGLVGVLVTVTVLEDIGVVRPVKTD